MKTLKKLMLFAILALAPTAMLAADHIVFIHGYQLTGGRADTWDRMLGFMTNSIYGTPFVSADKVLVVQHGDLSSPIADVANDVWDQIKNGFPDGTRPEKMDFVVHSMGGLVLRSMVEQNLLLDSRIDRVVTLATPHYGQRRRGSEQQRNMEYGAEFIWNLATTSKKITSRKVLCVVGTIDGVVDEWSAALQDKECAAVRYVKKDHTAFMGGIWINDAICFCQNKRDDVVYRLVTDFLSGGTVVAGSGTGSKNAGAILFKVVDAKGKPVAYNPYLTSIHGGIASAVKTTAGASTPYSDNSPNTILGIGSVVYRHSEISAGSVASSPPKGVEPGQYVLDIPQSRDKVFSAFTSDPIPVVRGRTTVQTIYAESVRPLDYVFLIDTTGSMGSHINSVKSNAKNLIQTKLLNGARDCRVAVVDYRDFPDRPSCSASDYPYDVKCRFTSDAATAISAINSLSLGNGGDDPETVYSGIYACIKDFGEEIGRWRENAIKTIMVLGDAPPLDPEPKTGYTAADVTRWANTLKVDGDDTESGIVGLGSGISIYPVLTDSSSSLLDAFSGIAEETGGKVVSSSDYSSVADAVEEVIVQSVSANGFETEIVTARETDGNVTVRIFGGNETEPASIGYQIVSGSAERGKDFTGTDGIQRLSWAAGERSYKEIVVPVAEDSTTANDKFFSVVLCNPSGMGLGGINVCRVNLLDRDSSGEYSVRDTFVQGVSRDAEMGDVTGSGFCASGATVTLTAVANPGYVFTSWENGSTAARRSVTGVQATSNAVDGVATCVASFIPLADLQLPTIEMSGVVTGVVNEAFYWNLDYYSVSEATATCSGLPPGLVFADGVVSGTPTDQGRWTTTFMVENAKGTATSRVEFDFVARIGGSAVITIEDGVLIGVELNGATSITIPNDVTSIGDQAFRGCSGLTSVTIPNSVTNIGNRAFAGCTSLESVTVPDSVTSFGEAVFFGCSSLKAASLPGHLSGKIPADTFENCHADLKVIYREAEKYTVTFGKNGGTGGDDYVTATYGQPMPTPCTAPKKSGYVFDGYWTTVASGGVQYYDGSMRSVRNWDMKTSTTLYAKWVENGLVNNAFSSAMTISGLSGSKSGGNVGATMEASEPVPSAQPLSTGSVWYKWTAPASGSATFDTIGSDFDTILGVYTGTSVSSLMEVKSDDDSGGNRQSKLTFDAVSGTTYRIAVYGYSGDFGDIILNWNLSVLPSYKVTLGKNGGTGGDSYVTATYGRPMPTPRTAPTKKGWTFSGYWDTFKSGGKQYYDKDMKSVRNWDKQGAATLWAKWTARVTLGKNGGTGGDDYVTAIDGQPLPMSRIAPKKAGWTFAGYWDTLKPGGNQYYDANMKGVRIVANSSPISLWAKWTNRVTLEKNGGTGGDSYVTVTEGQPMPTPRTAPKKNGRTFAGYWDTLKPGGKQYYDAYMKSVRTVVKTAPARLWARWTNRVTFGKNGGTGGDNYVTATEGQPMPTPRTAPKRDGYVFDGYWTTMDVGGIQYYDGNMESVRNWDIAADTTLWAKWNKEVVVKVTLGKNGGIGGDGYVMATCGHPMPTPRTAPTKKGWTFAGYWDTMKSGGKQYYDKDMKSVRNWDKKVAVTLWAKWTTRVTFGKNGGTGGDDYVTVTEGQPMPTPRRAPTKSGCTFDGYCDTLKVGGRQYYDKDMKSIRNWDK